MKRLIKKAFGKTLYHGTNWNGLLGVIQMGGIFPNENEGAGIGSFVDKKNFEGFTFFATSKKIAEDYAREANDFTNPKVVLEVDISEDALLPDDNDIPDAKTWQESSEISNQVKVSGPITSNFIKQVYLYWPVTMEPFITSTIDNVLKDFEQNKHLFDPEVDDDYENEEQYQLQTANRLKKRVIK